MDKQLQKQIDDARSIYLFDGWYRLGDLKRMIAEAEDGERNTMTFVPKKKPTADFDMRQLTLPEIGEKE